MSEHTGPEESPGYLLWKVSTLWRRSIESALKPLGLTHPQFVVLAAIGWLTKEGKAIRQIELARFCALDANTISQILRGLNAKKLIERKAQDGRSKSPMLTEKGASLLQTAVPIVEKEDRAFFRGINVKTLLLPLSQN
jgi:DNA-binding MarR family transcriptional regulator